MTSHFLGTLKPRLSISGTRFDECGWVAITTSLQVQDVVIDWHTNLGFTSD
jgi:hypothetical protein